MNIEYIDSRELYNAAGHLSAKLAWEMEWIHFGTGNEIKTMLFEDLIKGFFNGGKINFVFGRKNSATLQKPEVLQLINELLGKENFQLWSEALDRAIRFNRIGVLQKGQKDALQQML